MLRINEIAFVGYPATDRNRARAFYEGLLGLEMTMTADSGNQFWIEYDIGAGTLGVTNYWFPAPEKKMGPIAALEVGEYEQMVARLRSAGVPILETNESPVCFSTMIADPDGNSLFCTDERNHPLPRKDREDSIYRVPGS